MCRSRCSRSAVVAFDDEPRRARAMDVLDVDPCLTSILLRCSVLCTKVVVASDCSIGATTLVATGALLPLVHDLVECGIVENFRSYSMSF